MVFQYLTQLVVCFVFIVIAIVILSLISLLVLRDYFVYRRLSVRNVKRLLKRGQKALLLGHFELAEKALLPLYQNGLGGKEMWLLYTKVLRGTRRFDEAFRFVKYSLRKYPEDLRFKLEEGRLYLSIDELDKALEAFYHSEAILRDEDDFFDFAKALFQANKSEEAAFMLEPFLLSSNNTELLALGGEVFLKEGACAKATALFEKALALGATKRHTLLALARGYQGLGSTKEAEKLYRRLLKRDDSDLEATIGLGECYFSQGYFQKAFLLYQAGSAWESGDPILFRQTGIAALHTKRFSFAERCFAKVAEMTQAHPELLSYLGYSLECQQKWGEAEQLYLNLALDFPDHPHGYRALAWLFGVGFSQSIAPQEGVALAHKALNLMPDPLSWEILSACEARSGNFARAHQIQEHLFAQDQERRHLEAMRTLRKQLPLEDHHISRSLVA